MFSTHTGQNEVLEMTDETVSPRGPACGETTGGLVKPSGCTAAATQRLEGERIFNAHDLN